VILLPNNENVILAAEQAAKEADKRVWVVPTTSMQAGLSAAVAYDPDRSGDENSGEMAEAAAAVRAGAVTRASRTTALGGVTVEEGEFVGFVEGEAVASGPVLDVVARAVVERLLTEQTSLLTVLLGDDVAEAEELRTQVEAAHPAVEIEVHHGGQPHYPLLFSAE
jgi:dihydroxyacetone kinase-like predicted kinase